jgi:hypothetical protein
VPCERLGLDVLMKLHARACSLRRDRVCVSCQPLDTGDRDVEVLAARGEDLLVQQRIAGTRAEGL